MPFNHSFPEPPYVTASLTGMATDVKNMQQFGFQVKGNEREKERDRATERQREWVYRDIERVGERWR